jgi:Putative phage serine protease XkdF
MKENEKLFNPTDAVIKNASRGRALLQKHYKSELDSQISLLSEKITKGSVSLDTVKELYSTILKAQDVFEPKKATEVGPTVGTCDYYALGGTAGLSWCRQVLKSEGILKSYTKDITDSELNTEESSAWTKIEITKNADEELKQVLFVCMVPDLVDAHGDVTTVEEVAKACHNFNQFCGKANLLHLVETETFSIVESYIAPTDFILGDKFVTKGTWLVNLQVHDDSLWELVKSGDVNGVSIGALAKVEKL